MIPIILASSSIYRQELFRRLQIPFTTFSPEVDETPLANETIHQMVCRLAKAKATVAGKEFPESLCIGSDTVAALGETILGKSFTFETAKKQLLMMSGQVIHFYTAVCLYSQKIKTDVCKVVVTKVKFRQLSLAKIENYLRKEQPFHSAGSFKSETLGSALISHFESDDPTAIIGLPLIALCEMLESCGIEVV